MARETSKKRKEIYSVEELLVDFPAFKSSFIEASGNITMRQNTLRILSTYCLLDIRNDMKKLVELLTPKDKTKKLTKE